MAVGPGSSGPTGPDPEIQYGTELTPHQHDDAMSTAPATEPACATRAGGGPTQPDGVRHMTQIRPNPGDQPEQRRFQVWVAVPRGGADDPAAVYVYEPSGQPPTRLALKKLPAADCAQLGSAAAAGSMLEAAVHTGQLSADVADQEAAGVGPACRRGDVALYYATLALSHRQPCGEYRLEAHAPAAGARTHLNIYVDVLCFSYLQVDFDRIDWGLIDGGGVHTITGDLVFGGPPLQAPTIRNGGNAGMGLGVKFTPMRRVDSASNPNAGGDALGHFAACFGRSASGLQCADPISASTRVDFDDDRERVLCAGQVGRLDLSVRPSAVVRGGDYVGSVDLAVRPVGAAVC